MSYIDKINYRTGHHSFLDLRKQSPRHQPHYNTPKSQFVSNPTYTPSFTGLRTYTDPKTGITYRYYVDFPRYARGTTGATAQIRASKINRIDRSLR